MKRSADENIGPKLQVSEENPTSDVRLASGLLGTSSEAQAKKEKVDRLDFIGIKNICTSKHTINKVKRQPTEWEEILANHIPVQNLYLQSLKQVNNFYNSTAKKTIQLKWTKDFHRRFSKEDINRPMSK